MKKAIFGFSVLVMCIGAQAQTKGKPVSKAKTPAKPAAVAMKNNNDSLSYAFGVSLGSYMKSQGLSTVNYALLNKAITTLLAGQKPAMDINAANQCMGQLAEAKSKKVVGAEKQKGTAFLQQNRNKSGVTETQSGLQYEVLTKGTGPVPTITDTIVAHYRGSLLDGKVFDDSYSRGEPITIPVGGVIAGWTEALQMMPVGSKWKLYIPAAIGYGDYGAGQDIPGGATLVFEVELLSIKNKTVTQ
jgi:FKBP-type peptidyl-prolyl cis-trans isomerase